MLDNLFKELSVEGVGASSKHHNPICKQNISQLWETSVLGRKDPTKLLNAVFFTTGLYCCLHVGEELALFVFFRFQTLIRSWRGPTLKELRIDKVAFWIPNWNTKMFVYMPSIQLMSVAQFLSLIFTSARFQQKQLEQIQLFISVYLRGCLMMQCYPGFQIKQRERTSLTQWRRECVWLLVSPQNNPFFKSTICNWDVPSWSPWKAYSEEIRGSIYRSFVAVWVNLRWATESSNNSTFLYC